MTGTVAPGRQCVAALKKWMSLVIESPTINVVGEKRGQGDGESTGSVRAGERCVEAAADRGGGEFLARARGTSRVSEHRLFKDRAPSCRGRRPARGLLIRPRNETAASRQRGRGMVSSGGRGLSRRRRGTVNSSGGAAIVLGSGGLGPQSKQRWRPGQQVARHCPQQRRGHQSAWRARPKKDSCFAGAPLESLVHPQCPQPRTYCSAAEFQRRGQEEFMVDKCLGLSSGHR